MDGVETKLDAGGQISIPDDIRRADHLVPGDSFDLERLTPGHYLLTKQLPSVETSKFAIVTAEDGLPVIRSGHGVITSQLVKELETSER